MEEGQGAGTSDSGLRTREREAGAVVQGAGAREVSTSNDALEQMEQERTLSASETRLGI